MSEWTPNLLISGLTGALELGACDSLELGVGHGTV